MVRVPSGSVELASWPSTVQVLEISGPASVLCEVSWSAALYVYSVALVLVAPSTLEVDVSAVRFPTAS